MPENPSQHDNPESAVASIQEKLANSPLGNNVSKVATFKKNEKVKDAKSGKTLNGQSAKLTVESNGQTHAGKESTEDKSSIEVAQNGTADHTGEGAPIAPYSEDRKENQKAEPANLNTESTSQEEAGEEVETHVLNENTDHKQKEKKSPEKELPNNREATLSRLLNVGDPVLLHGMKDFDTPGAWFYAGDNEMITDRSGKGTKHKSQVKIIFKEPDGEMTKERLVSWLEITPQYDSSEEYVQALHTIREKHKQAAEEGNTDYEQHLKRLLWQTAFFAQKFAISEKKRLDEEMKSELQNA